MDLLIVAREMPKLPATATEVADPADAKALLPKLPHGPALVDLLSRQALGVMVLSSDLERPAARAAIRTAMQRSRPKGAVLLGWELSRDLLGEGLPQAGGIRDLDNKPVGALGRAKQEDVERILSEVCRRAGVPWAPPASRAAPARDVVRAEEVVARVSLLMERQDWAGAVEMLREAEPLSPRGTNMLGRALLQLGDREGARHAFERTLEKDPGNAIAQRQLEAL